jgi:alpha-galactosidase
MMACPMFFSGDMATVDDFTYGLLCNAEMIAVNQDRLGKCAEPVVMDANQWVLKKPLADGSLVVGLFNLDKAADRDIAVTWAQLGLTGPAQAPARDLWRQRDVQFPADGMKVKLSPLGCAVFKIGKR